MKPYDDDNFCTLDNFEVGFECDSPKIKSNKCKEPSSSEKNFNSNAFHQKRRSVADFNLAESVPILSDDDSEQADKDFDQSTSLEKLKYISKKAMKDVKNTKYDKVFIDVYKNVDYKHSQLFLNYLARKY